MPMQGLCRLSDWYTCWTVCAYACLSTVCMCVYVCMHVCAWCMHGGGRIFVLAMVVLNVRWTVIVGLFVGRSRITSSCLLVACEWLPGNNTLHVWSLGCRVTFLTWQQLVHRCPHLHAFPGLGRSTSPHYREDLFTEHTNKYLQCGH